MLNDPTKIQYLKKIFSLEEYVSLDDLANFQMLQSKNQTGLAKENLSSQTLNNNINNTSIRVSFLFNGNLKEMTENKNKLKRMNFFIKIINDKYFLNLITQRSEELERQANNNIIIEKINKNPSLKVTIEINLKIEEFPLKNYVLIPRQKSDKDFDFNFVYDIQKFNLNNNNSNQWNENINTKILIEQNIINNENNHINNTNYFFNNKNQTINNNQMIRTYNNNYNMNQLSFNNINNMQNKAMSMNIPNFCNNNNQIWNMNQLNLMNNSMNNNINISINNMSFINNNFSNINMNCINFFPQNYFNCNMNMNNIQNQINNSFVQNQKNEAQENTSYNLFKNLQNIQERKPIFSTIGLKNVGLTCYMNSTLQCLLHIQELNYYFINVYQKDKDKLIELNKDSETHGLIYTKFKSIFFKSKLGKNKISYIYKINIKFIL